MRVNGIESEDELKKAQASAQAQGTSISNYNEWEQILKSFEEYGVESTGSYAGDKAKLAEIEKTVSEYIDEIQAEQQIQVQNNPTNKENEKVQEISKTDGQQDVKAQVVNANSSEMMANYMKYYHLLM